MTHEKIFDYMSKSHIFLAPSITSESGDQEGIPVVLMEAMAHRLPVISTYHSGIPELVINGKTGFLVKEGNVREIVEKIKFIISNPNFAKNIGVEARKFVERNYSIDKLNDDLVKMFEKII